MKVPPGTLYMRLAYVNACQGLGYLLIVCPLGLKNPLAHSDRASLFALCMKKGLFTAVWTFDLRIQ